MKKLTIATLLLFTTVAQAQIYKFGEIPREQLEMTVYEKDSTASSVVLFSTGESVLTYVNGQFVLTVSRHIRIKILTDEGLDEGDIEIGFRNRKSNSPQKVNNIKAQSYTLSSSGDFIKESVGRKDRFEEKLSETRSEIKFTIPGLKKGSVFEYSYELKSNNPLDFPDWLFQDNNPVIFSEYRAKIPEWFDFLTVSKGYHEFSTNNQKRYNDKIKFNDRNGISFLDFSGTEYHYTMEDIPAIGNEPYMKASIDYLSHIRFQLSSIQMPQELATSYLDTWGELVNKLVGDSDYGKRLRSSSELKLAASEAVSDADTELDKMIEVYNHVSKTMDWNEDYGLYAFDGLKDIYKEGTGNGTAINLILIQMLREAGLEAHPVAISTRFNGEIINLFPIAGQFNHTIAYVEIGDNYYLLDAKNEYRPYNLLPSQVLNGQGLIVFKNEVFWVPLMNQVKNSAVNMINIELNETGYKGYVNSSNKGFYAIESRSLFKELGINDKLQEVVFGETEGLKVDSAFVIKDKLDESFSYEAHFSYEQSSKSNIMYLNPMILKTDKENPFTLRTRTFPIDYDYTFSDNVIINITIPDGWIVDEAPKSILLRLPEKAGEFRRIAQVTGNIISVNYRFRINKERFMPSEYEGLKSFYDQMMSSMKENIVLKKES